MRDRDEKRSLPASFNITRSIDVCPVTAGSTPHEAKHWLVQPDAVWHCGIEPQSGMELWHGQSAALLAVICVVIAHDLAMATLATGAKAIISDSRKANMVRCKFI